MGNLLGVLHLKPPPALAKSAAGDRHAAADLEQRLAGLRARGAEVSAKGGKPADELKKAVAQAEAAAKAAANGDKAAVAKAERAIDVVQMVMEDAIAHPAAGAVPAKPYVPSPEAVRFTKHVKDVLAKVALLEAAHSPDAARLKKSVVEIAKLGHHEKERAKATAQLVQIEKDIAGLKAAAAPVEPIFDRKVGDRVMVGATRSQLCAAVKHELDALERDLQNGFETHCEAFKIQREEPFAAWISEGLSKLRGREAMPELEIWDPARNEVIKARRALKAQDFDTALGTFPIIIKVTRSGRGKIGRHNEGVIESAGEVVEAARKTEDAAATVISKSAEKMYGKGAGVAAGAAAKSLFKGAEELSAVYIAQTKKKVDWGAVAKEGAASFVSEMVGLLLHGYLFEKFSGLFGSYLKQASFTPKQLADMGKALKLPGPLDPSMFMTKGQKLVRDFLVNKAEGVIKDKVAGLIKEKDASDKAMKIDEFVKHVAKEAASGKLIDMLADYVVEHAAEIVKK
jgi:hypothetical protein